MSQVVQPLRATFAEYLALEEASREKHQLVNGEVFAMTGGTSTHARLMARMILAVGNAVEGGPCEVYASELRVRVLATGLATYPDVTIVCGPLERDPDSYHTITNPTVLVEVLSDSTEAFDLGEKFRNYRQIPSLRACVLVSLREARIEMYQRARGGEWRLAEAGAGERVQVDALACDLNVDTIYARVFALPPGPEAD